MRKQTAVGWSVAGVVFVIAVVFLISRAADRPSYAGPTGVVRPPMKGGSSAAIVVEEFSDFQCPACKSSQPVVKEVVDTFGDRIKLTYRHFPLVSIHTQAFRAALAAECANDQGKFWEYHDKLFENQPNFSRDELVSYANDLGITVEGESGFAACLDSRAHTEEVRADMREGDQRGLNGTPTFYVNGEPVPDWTQLKQVIQGKLLGA